MAGPERTGGAPAARRRSARGDARRTRLLEEVTDDLIAHGFADFSLRRAARACGTTHKVLLYHFGSAEQLLGEVVSELRARRIRAGLDAATAARRRTLAARVRAIWPALVGPEADALDQAMGLALTDPARYGALGEHAVAEYLPVLMALCPDQWGARRKSEVAEFVLATLRGLVLTRRTSAGAFDPAPALTALTRALDREEADDSD